MYRAARVSPPKIQTIIQFNFGIENMLASQHFIFRLFQKNFSKEMCYDVSFSNIIKQKIVHLNIKNYY